MSDFKDTSNWKIKDGTTLVYPREYEGKREDGESEKKPNSLILQVERLSVLNTTCWEIERYREPEQEAGFETREFISALGTLDNCRLHAITLDENENEVFTKLHVEIHPVPLEKLQETAKVDTLSIIGEADDKPEEGWMKDEIGSIHYHAAGEYYHESTIFASVFLAPDKFDDLVLAIKNGGIRSARMEIIADVFEFGYESLGAGMRGHRYNFAILCEDEGDSAWGNPQGASGETNARLQEVNLEWSPTLDSKMAARRDEHDEGDYLELDIEPVESDVNKVVARLSRDVQGIRTRVESFYQAAIVVVIILVVTQIIDWIGF